MADLTDPRVVHELELEAKAATGTTTVLEKWSELATAMLAYHEKLRDLMAAVLEPGDAQEAVYQRQARKAEEMRRFLASTGDEYKSSYLGS